MYTENEYGNRLQVDLRNPTIKYIDYNIADLISKKQHRRTDFNRLYKYYVFRLGI